MDRRTQRPVAAAVEGVRARIAKWRSDRKKKGARMPDALWKAAAKVARVHGINPVAQALGLDYYNLKRRVQAVEQKPTLPPLPESSAAEVPLPLFVEVDHPARQGAGAWVLELEAHDGAKMTVRLAHPGQFDLVALAESFWRRRR